MKDGLLYLIRQGSAYIKLLIQDTTTSTRYKLGYGLRIREETRRKVHQEVSESFLKEIGFADYMDRIILRRKDPYLDLGP